MLLSSRTWEWDLFAHRTGVYHAERVIKFELCQPTTLKTGEVNDCCSEKEEGNDLVIILLSAKRNALSSNLLQKEEENKQTKT